MFPLWGLTWALLKVSSSMLSLLWSSFRWSQRKSLEKLVLVTGWLIYIFHNLVSVMNKDAEFCFVVVIGLSI